MKEEFSGLVMKTENRTEFGHGGVVRITVDFTVKKAYVKTLLKWLKGRQVKIIAESGSTEASNA